MEYVWAFLDASRQKPAGLDHWRGRALLAVAFAFIPVVDYFFGYRSDFPLLVAVSLALFTATLGANNRVVMAAVAIGVATLYVFRGLRTPSSAELLSVGVMTTAIVYGARRLERLAKEITRKGWQLSQREAYLERLVLEMPTAIIVCDTGGRVLHANARADAMFARPSGDLLNRCLEHLVQSQGSELADALLGLKTNLDDTLSFAATAISGDGREFEVSVVVGEFETGDHRLHIVNVVDETERLASIREQNQLNAKMRRLGRAVALGQFGAAIAHEINQPLAAAANFAGAAQALVERGSKTNDVIEAIDEATGHIFRAREIVTRLRAFVGAEGAEKKWLPVESLLDEAVALSMPAIKKSGARLAVHNGAIASQLLADRVGMQQVLVNLLVNAAEALEGTEGGKIELNVETSPSGFASIRVCDNGTGLSQAAQEALFEPFASTKPDGVGIGLSISRSIVESHGGHLAYFDREGCGACFSFSIPCRQEEPTDVAGR